MSDFLSLDRAHIAQSRLSLAEGRLYLGKALLFRSTKAVGDEDADRLVALLTIAFRRAISNDVVRHVEAATAFWALGEKAVANFRLLHAGLPTTSDPTVEARLRLAEFCLDKWNVCVGPDDGARLRLVEAIALQIQ